MTNADNTVVRAALQAHSLGYTPVPIRTGQKRPALARWGELNYDDETDVRRTFGEADDVGGLGLLLGEASGGLVDVDLDHPKARKAAGLILLPTPMETGRASSRWSHRWYRVDPDSLPPTRRYKMPGGETIVELRANGAQTVIPPTVHPSGEQYRWEGEPWAEPAEVGGQVLASRVATLALVSVLLDVWPERGGRHDAYLALAGALLRTPTGLHPLWEKALPGLVATLAELTDDEDGPEQRVKEVVPTTVKRLLAGKTAQGWPTLSRIIGPEHTEAATEIAREIEYLLGFGARAAMEPELPVVTGPDPDEDEAEGLAGPRNPLDERSSSWASVDLGPYIRGEIERPSPSLFKRTDGQGLLYPGRVNLLYSKRESGKSWVSLLVVKQLLSEGVPVLLVDLEDEPTTAVTRLLALGASPASIEEHLGYIRPETGLAAMRSGGEVVVRQEDEDIERELVDRQPALVVVDGMTVLYALHGLDTNHSVETEVITGWLKRLTRNGKSTVLLIDHVTKSASRGSDPIGSQHKMAMVQGAAYHVWNVDPIVPGQKGKTELLIGKDRHGAVRAFATKEDPQVAAVIHFDSSDDGRVMQTRVEPAEPSLSIGNSGEEEETLGAMLRAQEGIVEALVANPKGLGVRELRIVSGVGAKRADQAIEALVGSGRIVAEKVGNKRLHKLSALSPEADVT